MRELFGVARARLPIRGLIRMEAELSSELRRLACVRLVGKIHSTGLDVIDLRDQTPELTRHAGTTEASRASVILPTVL